MQLLYHNKSLAVHLPGTPVSAITPTQAFADAFARSAADTGKPVIVVLPDYK
ncbi:MAG: hypothetical protein JW807_11470 [Spirochaetes bacterium]|nr:hypothetical protein [Spirochaetota bacterium]